MKLLVTTHAQMFQTPDAQVWTNSTYDYEFFQRYLDVFESVRLVTRMKQIGYKEVNNKVLVSGPNIEFYPLTHYHGPWEFAKNYSSISKELKLAIEKCDCALLRIPDQISFHLYKLLKREMIPCAVEVVAHSWDLFAPGTNQTILRPLLRKLWDINQKKICKSADGVSYVTKRYIQKRYPADINQKNTNRFETYYTSADLDPIFIRSPRDKESFNKKTLQLIHVAGINNMAKGHYELLMAMVELKKRNFNFNLTFIGGGTLFEKFKELSLNLGLEKEVNFVGHLSNTQQISEILSESDLFVFPTMTEGLPRVVIEAMASGLPVVSTTVGGIPELLPKEVLIEPNNIEALVDKIIEITKDSSNLEQKSKENYQKVYSNYRPSIIQKRRSTFYSKLKDLAN